jgi:hypothetical protein
VFSFMGRFSVYVGGPYDSCTYLSHSATGTDSRFLMAWAVGVTVVIERLVFWDSFPVQSNPTSVVYVEDCVLVRDEV